jgi:methylated-DNA-protein-cysteine methyltransferase-like protein
MSNVKTTTKNLNLFEIVYKTVKLVPEGNVATYGQIAEAIWKSQAQSPPVESGSTGQAKSKKRITPRIVGWALHANNDSKVPCHRVVDRNGRLAPNFGFSLPSNNRTSRHPRSGGAKSREGRLGGGGHEEQKRRLLAERVKFIDEMHVDLKKYLWQPKAQNTRDLN